MLAETPTPPDSYENLPRLTRREQEVLSCLLDGWRDKKMALHFGISLRTVEKHVENLRKKLVAPSRRAIASRLGGNKNT